MLRFSPINLNIIKIGASRYDRYDRYDDMIDMIDFVFKCLTVLKLLFKPGRSLVQREKRCLEQVSSEPKPQLCDSRIRQTYTCKVVVIMMTF